MKAHVSPRRLAVVVFIALLSVVLLEAQSCRVNTDRALQALEDKVGGLLTGTGVGGWRIHLYPGTINRGQEVAAFSLTHGADGATLTCDGRCLLFFVDTEPLAHFAHPTVIALYDIRRRELVGAFRADWWPTIDGRSVFNTVESRRRREWIIDDVGHVPPLPPSGPVIEAPDRLVFYSAPPQKPPVWAVLVNGYDDSSDTFDEDTVGMYQVLRGHGVAEDHIKLLRPRCQQNAGLPCTEVSVAAVKDAIADIGQQVCPGPGAACDPTAAAQQSCCPCDLLLFYSAHGITNGLACGTDPDHAASPNPPKDYISAAELKEAISENLCRCASVTVVVEACHSGSILNHFLDQDPPPEPPAVAQPLEISCVNGNSTGQWRMFASATAGETSSGDVDTANDKNPADAGSETIWGYVEAFGSRAADTDASGTVDFAEAVNYAKHNDATAPHHTPAYYPDPLPAVAVHGSDRISPGGSPTVDFPDPSTGAAAQPAGTTYVQEVHRGCSTDVTLQVGNVSSTSVSMPMALRVFRADASGNLVYSDEDELRTTIMVGGLDAQQQEAIQFHVERIPESFSKNEEVPLKATLDRQAGPTPGPQTTPEAEMELLVKKCFLDICCAVPSLCP